MPDDASERLSWAVDALDIQPDDQVLEIGCGHGVAITLVCEKLEQGSITAIDRSMKMTEMARKRNAACIAAGKAIIRTADFPDVDFGEQRFDTIFAVHVGFFWQQPDRELAAIKALLAPGGTLHLVFQPLDASRAEAMTQRAVDTFEGAGFVIDRITTGEVEGGPIVSVAARNGRMDG